MSDNRPVLEHRKEFEEILQSYRISNDAKELLANIPLVVLNGVAGGGRNTVIHYLVENYNYEFIISDTTRPPKFRDGKMEQDGVNYHFRNEEDLLSDLRNGKFVEAELIHNQQVSGTTVRELQRIELTGKVAIGEFEFGGANAVAEAKPNAAIIGLLPPSYDEWIRRLNHRENMGHQEFINRLVTAEKVLENMLTKPYFRFVISDTVEQCAESIRQIVERPELPYASQDLGRKIATDILSRVKDTLSKN